MRRRMYVVAGALWLAGCSSDSGAVHPDGSTGGQAGMQALAGAGGHADGGAGGLSMVDAAVDAAPTDASGGDAVGAVDGTVDATVDAATKPALFSEQEWEVIKTFSPLPALPADPTNTYADNEAAATFGQRLFFDKSYAGKLAVGDDGSNGALGAINDTGKIACASCHEGGALDDRRSKPGNVSLGADFLTRNALPLVNSSFYTWTNWAGRFAAQWELPLGVAENAKNMNSTRLTIAHTIFNKYKTDYEAIFGALEPAIGTDATRFPAIGKPAAAGAPAGAWEGMTDGDRLIVNTIFANYGKALQAFVRKLVVRSSSFDRFVAGEFNALTDDQQSGLKVFITKGKCATCHSGPQFSDNGFHALGVPQTGPHATGADLGRFTDLTALLASSLNIAGNFSDDKAGGAARLAGLVNPPDSTKGQFRTPSLRNVGQTAPFMHAGQFATLDEVVDFYNAGGSAPPDGGVSDGGAPVLSPLELSSGESAQLVEFLKSLNTDAVPAALLTDTSAN